ncbi:uncharacterized protein LOC144457863 [Phascolarctos cinereus]
MAGRTKPRRGRGLLTTAETSRKQTPPRGKRRSRQGICCSVYGAALNWKSGTKVLSKSSSSSSSSSSWKNTWSVIFLLRSRMRGLQRLKMEPKIIQVPRSRGNV